MAKKEKKISVSVRTRQKEGVSEISESEYKYRSLIENSPDVIMNLDRRGVILFINYTLPEYTVKSVIGTNISIYLSPEDAARTHRLLAKMFESGEPQTFEVDAAGPTRWLNRFFPIWRLGVLESALAIATDITNQKRTEQALLESVELNRRILEAVPGGIIQVDARGAIYLANGEAQKLLGLSFDEKTKLYGGDFKTRLVWEDGAPCGVEAFPASKCLATGAAQPGAIFGVRRSDGTTTWAIFSAMPLLDPKSGAVSGAVVTFLDISERKRGEEALKDSRQQLRDLSTHLRTMLEEERTRISREIHDELGQQLTILKMELSRLNKELVGKPEAVKKRIKSMSKLIDTTIQSVRKISTEMRPGVLDDIGLTAAIEWQVEDFRKRTGIRCLFAPHPEEITLDPGRSTTVFRIFQETLTNIVRHADADEIKMRLEKTDEYLLLEVNDNGRGITEHEIATSKSLGLLGIRERALLWGGTVQIHGTPGKGTTIVVKIPLLRSIAPGLGEDGEQLSS